MNTNIFNIKIMYYYLLLKIPVSAVLIAVSTKDSLPAIVWKKNSGALNPVKKLFLTNPIASGWGISSSK